MKSDIYLAYAMYLGKPSHHQKIRNALRGYSQDTLPEVMSKLYGLSEDGFQEAYQEFEQMLRAHQIQWISCLSAHYPALLSEIADFPLGLFYRGNIGLLQDPYKVVIVGTRKPSYDGVRMSDDMVNYLSKLPFIIISGLAFGIDALAHQGALSYGCPTIAVLASSVDQVTPRSHEGLAQRILDQNGLIISEYAPNQITKPHCFLSRNRIMSGMVEKVFVVEAGIGSGSLSTANHALEQSRLIYAMPGSRSNQSARGTNLLLRLGAFPVVEPEDFEPFFDLDTMVENRRMRPLSGPVARGGGDPLVSRDFSDLSSDSGQPAEVFQALKELGPLSVESLSFESGLPIEKVLYQVMMLTCQGKAKSCGDLVMLK